MFDGVRRWWREHGASGPAPATGAGPQAAGGPAAATPGATPDGGAGGGRLRPQVAIPAAQVVHARSLLGPDSAADLDADAARRVVDELTLRYPDFPPPLDQVPPAWRTPRQLADLRRLADAADRVAVADPGHAEAAVISSIALSARVLLRELLGPDEAARLALTGVVEAHHRVAGGQPEQGLALADEAVRLLSAAVLRAAAPHQPGLVLAHDAWALAAGALGRPRDAAERLDRAVIVLRQLSGRDVRHVPELRSHLTRLAELHTQLGDHDRVRAIAEELEATHGFEPGSAAGDDAPAGATPAGDDAPAAAPGPATAAAGRPTTDRSPADLRTAEAHYARAVEASQAQRFPQALSSCTAAVDAYRRADGAAASAGLARALWRQEQILDAMGMHEDALVVGREGLQILRALLSSPAAAQSETNRDRWTEQLARACTDLSVTAGVTQRFDEAVALAREAVDLCRTRPGDHPTTRTELGTALHNLSIAHANRAVATNGTPASTADLHAAVAAIDEAAGIREGLIGTAPSLAWWELANSLLHRGRLHGMHGRQAGIARDFTRAAEIATRLGHAGQDLMGQITQFARMHERLRPGAFRRTPIARLLR